MSNNAKSNERVILSGIAWYYGDDDLSYEPFDFIARSGECT